ncbi:MAG: TIGR00725 family protein [Proteobacteria bacterium]|nr:TIGR00725 family protein [Pseudomonadota bacterium]
MKRTPIIGVMGGGNADFQALEHAEKLGTLIAEKGWILLNGGRCTGIMEATAKGAFETGGITVGVLPDSGTETMSKYITIPIVTGMGHARNTINILSSDVVVACPGGAGTLSEIALSVKCGKPLILFGFDPKSELAILMKNQGLIMATSPEDVVQKIQLILDK